MRTSKAAELQLGGRPSARVGCSVRTPELSGKLQLDRVRTAKGTANCSVFEPAARMYRSNALIAGLEPENLNWLSGRLRPVAANRGEVLQRSGEDVDFVYFPTDAVIALGSETVAGETVNLSLLGREGALGVFEACGSGRSYTRATVLVPGIIWSLQAAAYRELFLASSNLRRAIHVYVEILLAEARQSGVCNALHSVENRLARILLELRDKAARDHLPLTQEAMSQLLGVQRTTVAATISALQKRGLIKSGRGVEILDGDALGEASCSCRETLAFLCADLQSTDVSVCEA